MPFRLKVSCIGYQTLEGAYHQTELGTLMLRDDVHQLQEVEVNASTVREFSSHSTYRIDLKKAKLFSNFLESLTLIPALSLDTSRELKATNGGEVIILINGVKSTQTALAALAAEDVKSVELYDTPPARFATAGIGALINVITKEKIRGGNLYIEANDAVTAWDGKNRLGINYTIDRLRLNATYSNIYWRYKASEDEEIRYRFLGQDYYQKKIGIVAPGGRDNNELQLSCSYSVPKNYLLSSSLLLHHYRQDLRTDQIVSDGSLSGSKISKGNGNRYTMLWIFTVKRYWQRNIRCCAIYTTRITQQRSMPTTTLSAIKSKQIWTGIRSPLSLTHNIATLPKCLVLRSELKVFLSTMHSSSFFLKTN